ncbi:uncharacterized protein LOC119295738 isoform X2 [Triticum dicoccoides]|uniref:uncharacterized protein LOC119295738 isoform X2 n=1 Tax=Triticum dicoccoides TaxID=85692 RepID=UPI00188E3604|nr:uncharacterized protein LOC119295738 isoform X2 [Triticum dicoccoides]
MFVQCFFSGYWFPLKQMNYIVTLNCRDKFPQSSLDKSNSTGSPVRQVLPAAMPASWPIEETMHVSCTWWCRLGSGDILVRLYINNSAMTERSSVQNIYAGGGSKIVVEQVKEFSTPASVIHHLLTSSIEVFPPLSPHTQAGRLSTSSSEMRGEALPSPADGLPAHPADSPLTMGRVFMDELDRRLQALLQVARRSYRRKVCMIVELCMCYVMSAVSV